MPPSGYIFLVVYGSHERALNDDKFKEYDRSSQELIQLGMNPNGSYLGATYGLAVK